MKRIYITPSTHVVNIEAEQMIAASVNIMVDSSKTTDDRFTEQRRSIWDSEDYWK